MKPSYFEMHVLDSHVSLPGGEKNTPPTLALFKTEQHPIPQAVHLREKRACGYINLCPQMCVWENAELWWCRTSVTHGFTAPLLALPAALPSSKKRGCAETLCCCTRACKWAHREVFSLWLWLCLKNWLKPQSLKLNVCTHVSAVTPRYHLGPPTANDVTVSE